MEVGTIQRFLLILSSGAQGCGGASEGGKQGGSLTAERQRLLHDLDGKQRGLEKSTTFNGTYKRD